MIDFLKAALLGAVEGFTEFLPVSSTGHLIIVGDLLSFSGMNAETFEIAIQSGAILAVVFLFWRRFLALLTFNKGENSFSGLKGILLLAVGCFPPALLGLMFHKSITENFFNPTSVAIALIFGALLMLAFDKEKNTSTTKLEEISFKQAILIGLIQSLSLWPGMSRSGSTIIGGLIVGLSRQVAAEFSFLLAVPLIFAATGYQLYKEASQITSESLTLLATGTLVSFVTGVIAITWMIKLLQKHSFFPFAIYRIALGILILLFM